MSVLTIEQQVGFKPVHGKWEQAVAVNRHDQELSHRYCNS